MDDDHAAIAQTPEISLYEQSRELRIRENLERMQKLGIVDLSLKLKSSIPPKHNRRKSLNLKASPSPREVPPAGPLRRSSRLQNVTPATYSEVEMEKKSKSSETNGVMLEEGAKPEVYSEEHEKLLGNTEKSWTLFVDGYGKDGKRIYDPVRGKTCHQCRQKTLGHRTSCSKCNMVQGQFCGDCLYMRYGEHVLEAQETPNWICPVCRGICNCSLCRQAKGWPPTGMMYKKIARMGFKSVAHFLIQTRRSQPSSGQDPTNLASAKRSLSFTDFEVIPAGSAEVNDNLLKPLVHHTENNAVEELDNEKQSLLQSISNNETEDHISAKRSLDFSCPKQKLEEIEPPLLDHEEDELKLSDLQFVDFEFGEDNNENGKELHRLTIKNDDNPSSFEICPMPEKKLRLAVQSNTNSIAGRSSQVCSIGNDQSNKDLSGAHDTDIIGQTISENLTGQLSQECGNCSDIIDRLSAVAEKMSAHGKSLEDPDGIYGRLRKRHKISNDNDGNELPTIEEQSVEVEQQNKKTAMVSKSGLDHIVQTMRQAHGDEESEDDGGVKSLSGKKTKASPKLLTFPDSSSESIARRLRPRLNNIVLNSVSDSICHQN